MKSYFNANRKISRNLKHKHKEQHFALDTGNFMHRSTQNREIAVWT